MNVPPDEFVLSKSARNFDKPTFIGHRSPKTRSDLVLMGFDRDQVDSLPADEYYELNGQNRRVITTWITGRIRTLAAIAQTTLSTLGEYYAPH